MKFLLTSAGISNETIENEIRTLIGKDLYIVDDKEMQDLAHTSNNQEFKGAMET